MNTNLEEKLKYSDFFYEHLKMDECEVCIIEVKNENNQTSITIEADFADMLQLANEVYLTPLQDRGYALMTSNTYGEDSIRLEFDKGTTTSTDKEGILRFLKGINVNMDECPSLTLTATRCGSYAIILL